MSRANPSQLTRDGLPAGIPDPSTCVFRHVLRTSRAVASVYDAALAPVGLTASQFNLMMTLHRAGPQPVGQLAKIAAMDASTIPRAVKPLVERDLIVVRDGADRRQRIVSLTGSGRRTVLRAAPVWAEMQRAVVRQFGETNWQSMIATLGQLRSVLRHPENASGSK